MSAASFSAEYDGPALEAGRMDVRDLAPALLAIGELCEEANAVLNGTRAKVAVEVRADFRRGSFDVSLHLGITWLQHAAAFLMGAPKDAKDILELLGFYAGLTTGTVTGVTKLVKAVGRRKITEATNLGNGTTKLVVENNVTILVGEATWRLYQTNRVCKALEELTDPLRADGVDEFRVVRDTGEEEKITKDDLPSFQGIRDNLADPGVINDTTVERVYEITTGSKAREYIWRLSDGANVITAHIADADFFKDLEEGRIVVSLGDLLRVRVRSVTAQEGTKLKTTHTVEKVIEHKAISRQGENPSQLDFG